MASDSATVPTAGAVTPTEEPLENNKVNEEAKLMEKETVLLENTDVVKDKPASDSNLIVPTEDQIEQSHTKEPEIESPEAAEKSEESTEKGKDEEVAEQVELKEQNFVKECVEETNGEKAEEKPTMESVAEEVNKEKEDTKMVDVSESTDEAKEKQVEPVELQPVKDGIAEAEVDKIKDVEPAVSTDVKTETTKANTLEVELNPEASEQVETHPKEAKESPPEVEVKAVEKPEAPEAEPQVKLEDRSMEEKSSESSSTPEKVVSTNQDSGTDPKKETKEDASSPANLIENIISEEKHVVEEPSKDEKVSEVRDVITKLATEPTTDIKTEENSKETDTKSKEKEISDKTQEESVTEKVAEATEPTPVVKEEAEITVKEVAVKQKHSNSIISKVKQSFVKAKKAIIGKSPSSKTISTEAEGEIKVQ